MHYMVAHRSVSRSKVWEQVMANTRSHQEAIEMSWHFGCTDAIGYTLTTYIPTFAIYSIAFAILAMTPLRDPALTLKKKENE